MIKLEGKDIIHCMYANLPDNGVTSSRELSVEEREAIIEQVNKQVTYDWYNKPVISIKRSATTGYEKATVFDKITSFFQNMKKSHDSFDISNKEIVQSLDQIKKEITVNRDFDIPYLCGYSKDAKTIYIDRHLPKMKTRGHFDSDDALIMHEATEKAMENTYHMEYAKAHQIALRAEKAYVESQGISWKGYNYFMQKYIKKAGDERLTETPKDLDLQPYRDCHDYSELTKISKVQK